MQEADSPVSFDVAVIMAWPVETAVIRPFSSTEAIPGSEETQDTDLSAILSGNTVAVSFITSPKFRETFS